jgi:hypothetical protein
MTVYVRIVMCTCYLNGYKFNSIKQYVKHIIRIYKKGQNFIQ